MMKTKVKICGLIKESDAEAVNKYKADFAGFVLYYPKSKRNLDLDNAKELMKLLDSSIKKVAVTVSPDLEQIKAISASGFDYIQIHGDLNDEMMKAASVPIIKAFNVKDIEQFEFFSNIDKVHGFVFDATNPGSGQTFDWNLIKNLPKTDKMIFLSGGLNAENVCEGIKEVAPDVVDVSSGVEYKDRPGKDPEKIREFINNVNNYCI